MVFFVMDVTGVLERIVVKSIYFTKEPDSAPGQHLFFGPFTVLYSKSYCFCL